MPKKKFIDKKNAVTFHLVHRSQQDPLTADETAPQRVLLPVSNTTQQKTKQAKEEEHKFGIFFDDDYNYLQHLKESNHVVEWVPTEPSNKDGKKKEKDKLTLPSSVFASTVEEDVGLLNKAAPSGLRLDLDPDIIAAMDEDFNYDDPDNELEDDFMDLANAECSDEEDDYYDDDEEDGRSDVSSNFEDEAMDEVGSLDGGQFTFKDEETKSRFTDYSMSSSDIKRNDQLTLLDERFEQMFAKYDDTEIGPLDCDEIAGYVPENSDLLLQYAAEFERDQQRSKLDKEVIKNCVINQEQESDDSNDEFDKIEVKPKEKWDCESILSTYSNLYNHPKVISEPKSNKIKLNSRGIPVIESNRLTARALKNLDDSTSGRNAGAKSVGAQSVLSTLSTLSIRPKGETPEERNIRKKELKDYRKERRIEKKANAEAFKEEAKRQVKININNRMNIQGNRIL